MPGKYRTRTEITALILQAANGREMGKTKMMYAAFLSHAQLKGYLSVLVENGLLEHHDGTDTYQTTEKGVRFLTIYETIKEISPEA
jgi:predicted transcriptional regulator